MEEKKTIEISTGTIIKIFALIGIVLMALVLQDIIVMILIAFILSSALAPLVDRLQTKKVPRPLAAASVYIAAGVLLYFLFRSIIPAIVEQIHNLSVNRHLFIDRYNAILGNFSEGTQASIRSMVKDAPGKFREFSVNGFMSNVLGIFSGFFGFFIVMFLTLYFLLDQAGIKDTLSHYLPEDYRSRGLRVYSKVSRNMHLWFRGQLLVCLSIGVFAYIGLRVIGIDYALTLAALAAFAELIPIAGPYIGGTPAILIALAASPVKALYVAIFYVALQFLEGQFVVPQIMRKALGLSPAFTIISILIGAKLFGILGVLLAVPVASILSVIVEEIHEYDKIEAEEALKTKS